MLETARKHKGYGHVVYAKDVAILEKCLKQALSELPTLFSSIIQKVKPANVPQEMPGFQEAKDESEISLDLKTVFYPMSIILRFADIAEENTQKRIETCGILCGVDKKDKYIITNILIPDQRGTPDSCTTLDYEAISKYVMSNNLVVLGWIHTHPEYVLKCSDYWL